MQDHIDRVLIDRHTIAARVREMAEQIAADFRAAEGGCDPVHITIVPILTGSLIFLADLIRHLPLMMQIKLVTVSSYPGKSTSSQGVELQGQLPEDLTGHHILIVDDILDSGRTIKFVTDLIAARGPASVRSCMLLRKQIPSAINTHADYIGFEVPDEFVVGYGLDYDGFYRNLPEVVVLKKEVFA
ncbi:hypoxanthine phosphoribosyltransferase [Planctomycetales bacterium ZRK34]|nr:hypoxanthine phosphoribosyltransferase [Planctomycetales bacterium ZRK34]